MTDSTFHTILLAGFLLGVSFATPLGLLIGAWWGARLP